MTSNFDFLQGFNTHKQTGSFGNFPALYPGNAPNFNQGLCLRVPQCSYGHDLHVLKKSKIILLNCKSEQRPKQKHQHQYVWLTTTPSVDTDLVYHSNALTVSR